MSTRRSEAGTQDPSASPYRIFIVDDHPIFRLGLGRLIEREPDFQLCGEAESAAQALSALREVQAELVLVDMVLPGSNGIELIKHLRVEHPELRMIALSALEERDYALRALRAGASGYVMKGETVETLVPAIRKVRAGGLAVSETFGEQLIFKVARGHADGESPVGMLSDRELEVLDLVGHGRSTQEIAGALNLSVKTVESHRLHIKEKLGLKSSAEMVRFAIEWVGLRLESVDGGQETLLNPPSDRTTRKRRDTEGTSHWNS